MKRFGSVALIAVLILPVDAREINVATPEALQATLNKVQPGDTIVMASGEWSNLTLKIDRSGEPDKPVTIRAAVRGKTQLTGASQLDLAASYVIVDGLTFTKGKPKRTVISFREDTKHNRVTNCSVVDYNAGHSGAPMWVSLRGANHRVDHCAFIGRQDSTGLMRVAVEDAPSHHRIDHNYFANFALTKKNGGETIRVIDTLHPARTAYVRRSSKTIVEYNLFEDCHGEGAEIISNKSSDNIYRGNTFRRSIGSLTLRQGKGCLVEGNFFLGEHTKGTMGVRVLGTDHRVVNNYFEGLVGKGYKGTRLSALSAEAGFDGEKKEGFRPPVERLVLENNTIVDCTRSIVLGRGIQGASLGPTDCVIRNNVVVSTHGQLLALENRPEGLRWEANVMSGDLGIDAVAGITVMDLKLQRKKDGLLYPTTKLNAGALLAGEDGRVYRPLNKEDVGPFGKMGR